MPPRIHCVRHAQGYHNLSVANHSIHDPLLTPLGEEQCRILSQDFPYMADVDLVVASPLKRTMYTALYSFPQPIKSRNLKVIALPELQETSDLPCDTGSEPAEVERELKGKPIDLSILMTPEYAQWCSKKGKWAPHADAIQVRAREVRQWLSKRPEKDIVVVTHGGFLHYMTEDWDGHDKFQGTGWANTEFRSYTFDMSSGNDARMLETEESLKRRAGTEKPLSKEEQKNLHRSTTARWQEQSYQKARDIHAKRRLDRAERDVGGYGF